jgi:hypothetical protein
VKEYHLQLLDDHILLHNGVVNNHSQHGDLYPIVSLSDDEYQTHLLDNISSFSLHSVRKHMVLVSLEDIGNQIDHQHQVEE